MDTALRQLPNQPGFHSAEQEAARFRPGPGAVYMVEDSLDFRAGKIGLQH